MIDRLPGNCQRSVAVAQTINDGEFMSTLDADHADSIGDGASSGQVVYVPVDQWLKIVDRIGHSSVELVDREQQIRVDDSFIRPAIC